MAHTTCLVFHIGTISGHCKNALGRSSGNSGHITKLEQSRFSSDIYVLKIVYCFYLSSMFRGRFVKQKLPLSCSLGCDQIYNNHCYVFGHTWSQTHLRGQFVEQKAVLSCSFRCDRIPCIHVYDSSHTLLCCLSPT